MCLRVKLKHTLTLQHNTITDGNSKLNVKKLMQKKRYTPPLPSPPHYTCRHAHPVTICGPVLCFNLTDASVNLAQFVPYSFEVVANSEK